MERESQEHFLGSAKKGGDGHEIVFWERAAIFHRAIGFRPILNDADGPSHARVVPRVDGATEAK